ncbi:HEAT repeat domain-containing protein, partial [bacterium]|nr:HEAT repeat domain-containing protein [bacterium]
MCQSEADPELKYLARKAFTRLKQNSKINLEKLSNESKELVDKLLKQGGDKRKEVYQRVFNSDNNLLKIELLKRTFQDVKAYEERVFLTDLIKSSLLNTKSPELMAILIKALGIFGSEKEVTLLQKYLNHKDARIIANAVESLDFIGVDYSSSMVSHLLSHEDNRVRGNAIQLIFKSDQDKGCKEIQKLAVSDKAWMRSTALYCISNLDFQYKNDLLFSMLIKEWDLEIKEKIMQLCEQIADLDFARDLCQDSIQNNHQEFSSLLTNICKKLSIDESLLKQEVIEAIEKQQKTYKSDQIQTSDQQKKMAAKSKVQKEKEKSKQTPLWQVAALSFSLFFVLSSTVFFKMKFIDQKSYTLDPFSQKKSKSKESTKLLMSAERLINQKKYKDANHSIQKY